MKNTNTVYIYSFLFCIIKLNITSYFITKYAFTAAKAHINMVQIAQVL